MSSSTSLQPDMLPKAIEQARLDSFLGATLLQALFTGLYCIIFIQAIGGNDILFLGLNSVSALKCTSCITVALLRTRQHRSYATVLTLLFSISIVRFGINWKLLRNIFISHNDTAHTMFNAAMYDPSETIFVANVTFFMIVWVGDLILAWRCYVLWNQNKFVLFPFAVLMLGQIAIGAVEISLNLGDNIDLVNGVFLLTSLGVTILATGLIIYRIVLLVRDAWGEGNKYHFTIEVLLESGALYAVTLTIGAILLVVRRNHPNNGVLWQAANYWDAVLPPIAGVAPTLIALRIARKRRLTDRTEVLHQVSTLQFRSFHREQGQSIS